MINVKLEQNDKFKEDFATLLKACKRKKTQGKISHIVFYISE